VIKLNVATVNMTNAAAEIYLGRQSILDRKFELHAFELLLRLHATGDANVIDDTRLPPW